jgi:hypothetical protein
MMAKEKMMNIMGEIDEVNREILSQYDKEIIQRELIELTLRNDFE